MKQFIGKIVSAALISIGILSVAVAQQPTPTAQPAPKLAIESQCEISKQTLNFDDPKNSFKQESIKKISFVTPLAGVSDVFSGVKSIWVGTAVMPDFKSIPSTTDTSFQVTLNGQVYTMKLSVGGLFIAPTPYRQSWGVCSFQEEVNILLSTTRISVQSFQFGTQRDIGTQANPRVYCQDMTVTDRVWFEATPIYATLNNGKERLAAACGHRFVYGR